MGMRTHGITVRRRSILAPCVLVFLALLIPPILVLPTPARAVEPVPDLSVRDKPLDAGDILKIAFSRAPGDSLGRTGVVRYELLRQGPGESAFKVVRSFAANQRLAKFTYDDTGLQRGKTYLYKVRTVGVGAAAAVAGGATAETAPSPPTAPQRQWFFTNKLNTLVVTLIFCGMILGFIHAARRGKPLFIRRIAGLDAIDEAIGRCTEMGKPTLYIPGISTIQDVATIASLGILGQVAKKIAQYQTRIIVPNRDPIVFPVTQDVVKEAFLEAGYPHNYRGDDIYFVTNDQFAYAAAVCGTMVRERPGATLLLGMFFAESLVLAETGASVGAIQIAGTDAISQLPFFVTACDYTIIGEELYAAGAYIGREPTLLGTLKGQDVFKMICIGVISLGVLFMTLGVLIRGKPWDFLLRLITVRSGS
jgi:hypothetical protein